MPKPKSSKRGGAAAEHITDPRFANFESDPRYQLPSKKNLKTKLDKRFSRVLKDDDFVATAKVDRYGRKLKTDNKKKALEQLYEDEDEEDDEVEVEDDDVVRRELEAVDKKFDPARGGGYSSSEDDSESEAERDGEGEEETRPGIRLKTEDQAIEEGEVTRRIAIVNIDWDNIKSVDLFALFSSFVPSSGHVEKVSIYPSEFGKERLQREELEGPPREIFKKEKEEEESDDSDSEDGFGGFDDDEEEGEEEEGDSDADSDDEIKKELLEEGNDQDFDSDALRTYQLDRLRYYYAILECSNEFTAHKIYEATDGSEYLSSSNFLDLRFVPDDVTFDDEPRDECTSIPKGYKPVDFVTDALQHSKVKLTWDMHPEENDRKEALNKAFSGSRTDIAENDLRAYLASDSEGDDGEEEEEEEEVADVTAEASAEEVEEPKLSKKELARRKMRLALGLGEEPAPKTSKSAKPSAVGDMQITFTSALSEKDAKKKIFDEQETTIEKYRRKEREKKELKRAKMLAKREGGDANAVGGDSAAETAGADGDLGFDDPFFTTDVAEEPSKSAIRKEDRLKKRAAKEAEDAAKAAQKAELELLMADDNEGAATHLDHFDMKEIVRAEKQKNKKKGKKSREDQGGLQEEFAMDTEDTRFKAVFENHEFAIDPSNPKFKATQGMKKLLEVGRKKRKTGHDDEPTEKAEKAPKKVKGDAVEIDSLIDAVKKKAKRS
ncbi:hypothetical protein B0H63DRAFT_102136 [Podospora didyma]|uniref:NUC153 domain-containing protein n=1 Tax=Podospora didyma TaxID=330526 RepID=A0AAE0U3L0_9PEZI|nr:hypothetical protein B0H63DRAFT_102136 [Podospora didyma]